MTPSAHTSLRASTVLALRTCSGDMYCGDPSSVLGAVRLFFDGASSSWRIDFEMPKSSTFTMRVPFARSARNKFDGLRSRWTMPAACASAIASHASST